MNTPARVEAGTHLQVQFQEKRIPNGNTEVEPIRSISDGGGGVCVIIGAMETQI